MRLILLPAFMAAGMAFAQDLPNFEVDAAKWRESLRTVKPIGPLARVNPTRRPATLPSLQTRCAIPLRDVTPSTESRIRIVRPDANRRYAAGEASVPAEACTMP